MSKQLLLGDEAIAQAALDAGLSGVYAYPGTPSTEITEYIQMAPVTAEKNIHNRWCSNEKTAMEAALGMSFAGKRSLVCMKHVGMNVAADCFINSAITGVKGGLIVIAADDPSMHSSQNEQINTFITQGVDALIINPVMTSAADQIISTVKGADVPTVLINREPTADQMSAYDKLVYVGCDAAQSGTFQGELILDTENKGDINGDGKVSYIMIQGDPENIDAQLRTEYSVKALTDAGVEVEQLDLQRGDWDRNKGQEICQNDLAKYGDQIEVVFCNNDDMAIGALQAIQAAGRTVNKDIYLVGVDALDAAKNEVANGNMTGTVLNDDVGQATKAAEATKLFVEGKDVEQFYWVDYVKVTKDNASQYLK